MTYQTTSQDGTAPIAIIGMSCRLPGDTMTPEKLWRLCSEARDVWSKPPPDRYNIDAFYHPNIGKKGTINAPGGYFLDGDISHFDAPFFNITAEDARAMDPQQRMLLECAYEALESAGLPLEMIVGSNTAVYAPGFTQDYDRMIEQDPLDKPLYQTTGNSKGLLASRVSYAFDLRGPSMTIDTVCSSSLVALHLASQSLRRRESKHAIVGGVNLILGPYQNTIMNQMSFFSPDGRCYSFDDRANGYGRGEGAACVIVKLLEDAIKDGDPIRAVIRGSGINQDGRTVGITNPSSSAQESLIRSVYAEAGLDMLQTAYVEAHGSGTPAGDPIEARAIGVALGAGRQESSPLYIGSLKANLGHLEGISGLASVIKAVLMLEKGLIPPNLHFKTVNPAIPLDEWKLNVPVEAKDWPCQGPRRVSLNNFGAGGTNVHMVLEDGETLLPPVETTTSTTGGLDGISERQVLVLSAKSQDSCERVVENISDYLQAKEGCTEETGWLANLAYTLSQRRSIHPWKVSVSATSREDLLEALQKIDSPVKSDEPPRIGFVFTGQGAQWDGMARELIGAYRVFKDSLVRSERHLQGLGASWSILDELAGNARGGPVDKASMSYTLSTAVQIGLVDLLASWGVCPDMVIGHSSGEVAAAYAAGALTLETAMTIAYSKGVVTASLKDKAPHVKGSMMAVGLTVEQVQVYISSLTQGKVVVACINSPASVTVSGDESAIDELHAQLFSEDVFVRKLKVDAAYHSNHMELIEDDFLRALGQLSVNEATTVEYWSSVTGGLLPPDELDAAYWVRHMLAPVCFSDALANALTYHTQGGRVTDPAVLVEIGPHSALAGSIKQIFASLALRNAKVDYIPTLTRNVNACSALANCACTLFVNGCPIKIDAVNTPGPRGSMKTIVDLPPYPWDHNTSYWHESRVSRNYRFRKHRQHDLLGAPEAAPDELELRWRNIIRLAETPWLRDHVVYSKTLYPAAGFIAMAIEAMSQTQTPEERATTGYNFRDIHFSRALVIPEQPDGVEVLFTMRPATGSSWREFCAFSYSPAEGWTEHCRGLISTEAEPVPNEVNLCDERRQEDIRLRQTMAEAAASCKTRLDNESMYELFERVGLQFGSAFRNITTAKHSQDGQALSTICIPETKALMPSEFESLYIIHPTTLDAVLQSVLPAITDSILQHDSAIVPASIGEMFISTPMNGSPGDELQVHTRIRRQWAREVEASITVTDPAIDHSMPGIKIGRLSCIFLDAQGSRVDSSHQPVCFKQCWEPDVDMCDLNQLGLSPEKSGVTAGLMTTLFKLELAAYYHIQNALNALDASDVETTEPHLQRFYFWMKEQYRLASQGQLENITELHIQADETAKNAVFEDARASGVDGELLERIGKNIVAIIRKKSQPLSLMLEDDTLHQYYSRSAGLGECYTHMTDYIGRLAYKNPRMKILEIGAGTGGTTLPVLTALGEAAGQGAGFAHYDFTDISVGFFEPAQVKFSDWGELVEFRTLDIERDPVSQGFLEATYDLVIAANVLHATEDMGRTMTHVRRLLKPGGKLLLLEITRPKLRSSLIFGTLPGWWLGKEEYRMSGPTLSEEKWEALLHDHGFSGMDACLPDYLSPTNHHISVMISTALHHGDAEATYPPVTVISEQTSGGLLPHALCSHLYELTGTYPVMSTLERAEAEGRVCIVLDELSQPFLSHPTPGQFHAAKDVLCKAMGVLWITRGGCHLSATNPGAGLIIGLARAMACESRDCKIVTLDLDPTAPRDAGCEAETIVQVFRSTLNTRMQESQRETQFVERSGTVYIPRIRPDTSLNNEVLGPKSARQGESQPWNHLKRPVSLSIQRPGLLDTLTFTDNPKMKPPLDGNEVEIQTEACGLSVRDVMIATGQMRGTSLGFECSGIVTKTGANVTSLAVGDRVCTLADGGCSNYVRSSASVAQRIPADMGFEAAASIPLVFATAYLSLHEIARLKSGENVLIHGAAGGVGQAAIMLARAIGARIFATVGDASKKSFLMEHYGIAEDHIFSSRDPSFARGIMRMTGSGVDVILNSLAGELLVESWQCIATFGRFIEIGTPDIATPSALPLWPFQRHVLFASVDVSTVYEQQPAYLGEVMAKVMEMLRDGKVGLVTPITRFHVSEAEAALRLMQTGKQIGKIVLVPSAGDQVKVTSSANTRAFLRSDALYLIVGGFGGIGRAIARWMAANGARHIGFISRSGPESDAGRQLITDLQEQGVNVVSRACDIGHEDRVFQVLTEIAETQPPLAGVVHGGLVLRNNLLASMSHTEYAQVLRPKVAGSWNIYRWIHHWQSSGRMADRKIDFFIMLGSAIGVLGFQGQSNYAAASTFQDSLAYYCTDHGVPTVTIDLGVIRGAGVIAENKDTRDRMQGYGFREIHITEMMEILRAAITRCGTAGMSSSQLITGITPSDEPQSMFAQRAMEDPRLSHLQGNQPMSAPVCNQQSRVNVRYILSTSATLPDAARIVCDALIEKIARAVGVDKSQLSPAHRLAKYGVDSLVAVELRNWISQELKSTIPLLDLLGGRSIELLSHEIALKSELISPSLREDVVDP